MKYQLGLFLLLTIAQCAVAHDAPTYLKVPLVADANLTEYFARFSLGTPPQFEYLKMDSGSPNLAFLSSKNPVCLEASKPCAKWGTVNNATSSTSVYEGPYFEDELIDAGGGDYISDTIGLGGAIVKDVVYGYVSEYGFPDYVIPPARTICGLSLQYFHGADPITGPTAYLLPQLKKANAIDRMITSYYLGPNCPGAKNANMLLGGVYDKAKVEGRLFTVDMVDPHSELANQQTNSVNVTKIELILNDTAHAQASFGDGKTGVPVLLDTGTAALHLPDSILKTVLRRFGNPTQERSFGIYFVDCAYRNPDHVQGHVNIHFGSAGTIAVQLHELVNKLSDGTCGMYLNSSGDTLNVFGDPFFRSVYAILDQESFTVTLGQAKYTSEEHVVPIPMGGFRAPVEHR